MKISALGKLTVYLMIRTRSDFVILIPVYDEEESLPRLYRELTGFLAESPVSTSVLFINDGSRDKSQMLIESFAADDHRFHFIQLNKNSGLSAALKAGIDHCHCKWIGYMDADLQTTPADFHLLLEHVGEYELVTGIRRQRRDTPVKRVSSVIANGVRRWLINDGIEDTCCPLKIGHAAVMKRMPFFDGMHRFIPALVLMMGGKVKQVPVRHFPRLEGKAKYHLTNRLVGPFLDTLAFRWMQHHFIRYKVKNAM